MGSTTTVTEYEYDIDGRIKKETTTVTVVEAPVGPPAPPYDASRHGGQLNRYIVSDPSKYILWNGPTCC